MSYPIANVFDDLTYGFEFEFIGDSDPASLHNFSNKMKQLGVPYTFTGKYGQNDEGAWVLGADGSVGDVDTKKELGGKFGFELVSPVLKSKDFPILRSVLDAVKSALHGYTNQTCGTHVHVGSLAFMRRGEQYGNEPFSRGNCAVWLFSKTQPILWNHLVQENRANNRYCGQYIEGGFETDKYLALSCSGFMTYCKHPTMECRLHHGTLNADEIIDWALTVAHFLWFCFHEKPEIHIDPKKEHAENAMCLLKQFGVNDELRERLKNRFQ